MDMRCLDIPSGFEPFAATGPFFSVLGPMYRRGEDDGRSVLGLRVAPGHANNLGVAHGGMLATLADSTLGINLSRHPRYNRPLVTVSLNTDFLSSAQLGEWLESRVELRRLGSRLAFADCFIEAGGRLVLRASGVFAVAAQGKAPKDQEQG
jgi:uncharacterized protein (TIGR00369 family)